MTVLSDTAFVILLTLGQAEGRALHGYAILGQAKAHNGVTLQVGALYTTLARLLGQALIEEVLDPGNGRRRAYTITQQGLRVLADAARQRVDLARRVVEWMEQAA